MHPVPTSKGARMTRRRGPSIKSTGNSIIVKNQNIIEFSRTAPTGTTTVSADLIAANSTTFPFLSGIATRYDKIKWHALKMRWIPAVPTTTGGTISMYFDSDRKDAGATSVTDAMQNSSCKTSPVWDRMVYSCTKKQLRSNEMFTTAGNSTADANAENTFQSPGRVHFVSTPLTGVTFSSATTIGYLELDYHVELCFPTNPQTGVPTRRTRETAVELFYAKYDSRHVEAYQNFAAGCLHPPNFYEFLGAFDDDGNLIREKLEHCDPDRQSFELSNFLVPVSVDNSIKFSGRVLNVTQEVEDLTYELDRRLGRGVFFQGCDEIDDDSDRVRISLD